MDNSIEIPFEHWPKIPRLSKETMVITEKIDGTNAQIVIDETGIRKIGSRNRWITPESDNYDFAKWVTQNSEELLKLGHGRHYGEWYGIGIQRGYGIFERRFALFDTKKDTIPELPKGVATVPLLCISTFSTDVIQSWVNILRETGSRAVPGFMRPEGIVVSLLTSKVKFKILLENDNKHKGEVAA